ncbi:polysaccharide pyruvyl transferase family protein [Frigidibacter sp. MR17.14]|uniref:polysaccharide pyruvyl transferase family protein n=1 Tax=Frigidibacter sp. MR17.14 TaxID=3126509 RepID=UPI00301319A2
MVVPHVSSLHRYDWKRICASAGCAFLSPERPAEEVIAALASAPLVIAESMHAAIIADALRTPWHGLSLSPSFNDFKWLDWADSLDIPLVMHRFDWDRMRGTSRPPADPTRRELSATHLRPRHRPALAGLRYRVGGALRSMVLRRQLSQLAQRDGQLSSEIRLESRKDELRSRLAALAAVTREGMGPSDPTGNVCLRSEVL